MPNEKQTVWVAVHSHQYGEDITVWSSEALADKHWHAVARGGWGEVFGNDYPVPESPAEEYFAAQPDEWFEILERTVNDE